jgi:hypothetical protein
MTNRTSPHTHIVPVVRPAPRPPLAATNDPRDW